MKQSRPPGTEGTWLVGDIPHPARVALYSQVPPMADRAGAWANVLSGLAKGFGALGHRLDVLFPYPKRLDGIALIPGINPVRLPGLNSWTAVPALAAYLRARRPDAVFTAGMWLSNPSVLAARMLSGWRGALVVNHASHIGYKTRVEHRGRARFRLAPPAIRTLYPRSDGIAGVSEDVLLDAVKESGIDPQVVLPRVIPNPVDLNRVRARATEPIGDDWVERRSEPLIVSVGRLARQKNHALLLNAFARVVARRPARLLILGEGRERKLLEGLVEALGLSDRVRMPGHVKNPYPYMAASDIFALTSEEEGFGLVLVEAMALGIPVVVTDCPGGPRSILGDGSAGELVRSANPQAVAAALLALLDSPGAREHLTQAGLERAEDFSPSRVASLWLQFFQDIRNSESRIKGSGHPVDPDK